MMISSLEALPLVKCPPTSKFLRLATGQETTYSGSTESYSHSDETYILTDHEPMSSPSTPLSMPASTPESIHKQYSPSEPFGNQELHAH